MENFNPSKSLILQLGHLTLSDFLKNTPRELHSNFYSFKIAITEKYQYLYQCEQLDGNWSVKYYIVNNA